VRPFLDMRGVTASIRAALTDKTYNNNRLGAIPSKPKGLYHPRGVCFGVYFRRPALTSGGFARAVPTLLIVPGRMGPGNVAGAPPTHPRRPRHVPFPASGVGFWLVGTSEEPLFWLTHGCARRFVSPACGTTPGTSRPL
jgi:hypothetical protein